MGPSKFNEGHVSKAAAARMAWRRLSRRAISGQAMTFEAGSWQRIAVKPSYLYPFVTEW